MTANVEPPRGPLIAMQVSLFAEDVHYNGFFLWLSPREATFSFTSAADAFNKQRGEGFFGRGPRNA